MKFATKAIHAGVQPDPSTGAIMTPIFQTSTYVQESPGVHKGYEYSRSQNPTRAALERSIAALENGKYGLCFGSGMAAIDAILRLLKPGDEVIATADIYGGTSRLMKMMFEPLGIKFVFVDLSNAYDLESYVTEYTRMVWLETPTNPLLKLLDISIIAQICSKRGILSVVDNTFATPYLQNPLDMGVTIVMHSVTKYLAGHSDVIMGALVTNDSYLNEQLSFIQKAAGAVPGPQDCFLVLRGIKTLHLRMDRHCENAIKVAQWMTSNPKIGVVYFPGLESHPGYAIAKKQMRNFGGMISFELKDNDFNKAIEVMQRLELFSLAESLGGVECMCAHPASMSHGSMSKDNRAKIGVSDTLIRLSIGIEDITDILADLEQAIG